MSLFSFGRGSGGGIMNVIRCDEPTYLVWKWRPEGQDVNSTSRENSIRWGSSLRVKDGEVAVFVYKQQSGNDLDFIVGPFDSILKTANLPVLTNLLGLAYGGESPFQAEVYFINIARVIQSKMSVPYFDVQDPRFPDLSVPVAAGATLTYRIADYREFIKTHRLIDFTIETLESQIRAAVAKAVKGSISNILYNTNTPLTQIERNIEPISNLLRDKLVEDIRAFGVELERLDLSRIDVDKESENYKRLMAVTADYAVDAAKTNQDISLETARAQSDVNIRNLQDMQAINAENLAETMRIQREQAAFAQEMQTKTANMGAFSVEKQAEVLGKAAENLGSMGTMGTGVDGAGMGGFNPAAAMTGMAMGGAMARQMTDMLNSMGNTMGGSPMQPGAIPTAAVSYMVALNGQAAGPFDWTQLTTLHARGTLTPTTYVWRQGMPDWVAAGSVPDLQALFAINTPPPIPGAGPATPPVPPTPPTT